MIVLEADGSSEELSIDARTLRSEGPRASELRAVSSHLGTVRRLEDGWHIVGPEGAVGPNAYPEAENAIQVLLQSHARAIARRLAP
jgi:hypothetical protein